MNLNICNDVDDHPLDWEFEHVDEGYLAERVMAHGLPRPIASCGLPQPFIAEWDDLKQVHSRRRDWCVDARRCQVCGDPLGDEAIVCARPADEYVTDGAAIHVDDCWLLASTTCPELIDLARQGRMLVWRVPTSSLEVASPTLGGFAGAIFAMRAGLDARFYRVPTTEPVEL